MPRSQSWLESNTIFLGKNLLASGVGFENQNIVRLQHDVKLRFQHGHQHHVPNGVPGLDGLVFQVVGQLVCLNFKNFLEAVVVFLEIGYKC